MQIDSSRFKADFDVLAAIGATSGGGVHRPALGPNHLAARQWFLDRARRDGFQVNIDSAGNHSAVLTCPGADKTLLLGSHLDSVPDGGRYDGALGVAAALEVLSTIKTSGRRLGVNLEAVDFTDEEGVLIGVLGSEAMAGTLTAEKLQHPRCDSESFAAALQRADLDPATIPEARRHPDTLAGYLELHIEQGPYLAQKVIDIGIVTAIVGSRSFKITFTGKAGHAGTTPMGARCDAGLGASALNLALHRSVQRHFPGCVATVGMMDLAPGAFNIIPGRALLAVEFRSAHKADLDRLTAELMTLIDTVSQEWNLGSSYQQVADWDPVAMSAEVQQVIERSAQGLGLSTARMASGAGHDAQSFAERIPTGLLFIPSQKGISHNPQEFSRWSDCVNGAQVLLAATLEMAAATGS